MNQTMSITDANMVLQLYSNGLTMRDIGKQLNISFQRVGQILKKNGVHGKKKNIYLMKNEYFILSVIQHLQGFKTCKDVAKEWNIAHSTCANYIGKLHLHIPRIVKKCPRCFMIYPLTHEYFYLNKAATNGFESLCKICRHKEYMKRKNK